MKNKIFASIGGAVAALCPWVTHAETFPTDGNMLENTTYESAATYKNLGTYEGPVSAAAEYADILYQVGAGQYLPAGSEGVGAVCTAGNYCPGLTDATYNATDNQGLTACPDGYPMSDAGASMNTQCYTTCTDTSVIAHATAVAGNDYYDNGVDTCYATACDNGYHVEDSHPFVADIDTDAVATTYGSIDLDGSDKYNESEFGLTENGTWAGSFEYGTVYGQASCQSAGGEAMVYASGILHWTSKDTETVRSELTAIAGEGAANAVADAFAEYKAGTKTQEEVMKVVWAILGSEYDANFSKTDSGQYCYCQMTDFKPTDGIKASVTSAPWVFRSNEYSADNCANNCALYCRNSLRYSDVDMRGFRAALLGMLGTRTVNVCAANEISITWADADPADVAKNNAGVCTYDGDIRTPVKAVTKPGKTFKGWKFQKSN